MADLFISYSRQDLAFVRRLAAGLERRGKDVWVDLDDILPSAPWMAEIRVAIAEADAVVVVLSPASVASPVCETELQAAADLNKRLIPVVAEPTPIEDVPATLAALNFLDFSPGTDEAGFEAALSRLVDVLDTDLDAVHQHTRLLLRTAEWEDSSHDPARLLRGRQLTEAEAWLAQQGDRTPAPTSGQVGLIMASRRAAIRRQRGSMAVAASVALGLIGLSIFSVVQWHAAVVQRGQATSRADAAESQLQLGLNPSRALDVALQSLRAANTAQAQTALRNAVAASELRALLPPTKRAARATARAADGGGGEGQVAFDASGSLIAIANTTSGVDVWRWRAHGGRGSYRDPYHLAVAGAQQAVFVDHGQKVLVLDDQGRLLEWSWQHGSPEVLRRGLLDAVLNQSGDYLATVSVDTVSVTHATSGKPVAIIPTGPVFGAAFSPDGSILATWADTGPVSVWQASTGHLDESVGFAPQVSVHDGDSPVAINAQDDRLAVGGGGDTISVYSLPQPTLTPQVLDLTAPPGAPGEGDTDYTPGSLAWSPNGEELAAGGHDDALRVWSGNLSGQTFIGPVESGSGFGGGAGGVAFSPDGTSLASSNDEGSGSVWNWAAASDDSLSVPGGVLTGGATMSADGRMVAFAGNSTESGSVASVQLWEWSHFTVYPLTSIPGDGGVDLAFSPTGRWLAVSSEDGISVWAVATRRRLAFLPLPAQNPGAAGDLTFDPTGRWLSEVERTNDDLAHGRATLVDWHWTSSTTANRLPHLNSATGIAQLTAGGSIRFVEGHDYLSWNGSSRGHARVIARHVIPAGDVSDATYFDHGQQMMLQGARSSGSSTELVDLRTGAVSKALGQYLMEAHYVHSPDGRLLAGTALNGNEIVWDRDPADTPVTIPTVSNQSTVTLAAHVLLIAKPAGLEVVPDAYCGPLADVVASAKSLLVYPTSLAEATSY
jgi:WD40 repeat protein